MRRLSALATLSLVFLLPGCISFKLSAEDDPSLKASGLGSAYVGYTGFDEWDGTILRLGLLWGDGRAGEIFSFDVWPLGGIGIGLAGARVRVLPIELGAGALFYKPQLPKRHAAPPENLPPSGEPQGEPTQAPVEEAKAASEAGHTK